MKALQRSILLVFLTALLAGCDATVATPDPGDEQKPDTARENPPEKG
ncbi:MAG TPA: hypothetical protein VFI91_11750 [Longimicrobiaceae bacterium]|nr:hypothetical protein [Longimicrobiaceae bacterium]